MLIELIRRERDADMARLRYIVHAGAMMTSATDQQAKQKALSSLYQMTEDVLDHRAYNPRVQAARKKSAEEAKQRELDSLKAVAALGSNKLP